ncbi:MAG: ribosome small subunit-dependent GTPase A [Bacteroidetes bacterium]|nr:ribosome small subunit-dependent GTPase A [Bacteroidota bacterium]MBS1741054.1 ribosome small subunit-dependent GTPase A [Bacteroidota bacterium]
MKGIVYKSTGSWYVLRDEKDAMKNARIKGKLKIDTDISSTNPIAVGDIVIYEEESGTENNTMITEIAPRKNYIVRISPHNRNQKHIVAANLDLALVIATLSSPRTSQGFIDRFLITAEAYHIPAIIVINKIDLLKAKQMPALEHWKKMYQEAGYEVVVVSALDHQSLEPLIQLLKNKVTLFSGHSGVGKSTLINQLMPEKNLKTAEVSDWSGKGQHTTTFAEMFDLPFGGCIIDTPGVKEFGLIDIRREELSHYFPEIRALINHCKFNNCMHTNEPGCSVKQAVSKGFIDISRYESYLSIMETIEQKW